MEVYDKKLNKWGLPQEFKGIKFYPLKISEEDAYEFISKNLAYGKNGLHPSFIKMSYLKFMLTQIVANEENIGKDLQEWLSYITQKDVLIYYKINNKILPNESMTHIKFDLSIGDTKFTEYEFDKIREIILEQNGLSVKYIDEYDPILEESLVFVNRNNGNSDFEDYLFSLSGYLKKTIFELKEMTFYQFYKTIQRARVHLDYELFKPLEQSGQISFEDKRNTISDWLSHIPDRGRYDSILIKKDTFIKDNDVFKVSQNK